MKPLKLRFQILFVKLSPLFEIFWRVSFLDLCEKKSTWSQSLQRYRGLILKAAFEKDVNRKWAQKKVSLWSKFRDSSFYKMPDSFGARCAGKNLIFVYTKAVYFIARSPSLRMYSCLVLLNYDSFHFFHFPFIFFRGFFFSQRFSPTVCL